MFQFGRFPSRIIGMTGLEPRRVSPFGYLRLSRSYTPHRSFSQYNTSFLGTRRLGIHCVPLLAFRTIVRHLRLIWHALLGITFALIIQLLNCTRQLLWRRLKRDHLSQAAHQDSSCATHNIQPCGDKGTRTPDLVSAIDALSQLSYIPSLHYLSPCGDTGTRTPDLLGANEALSQLSYVPLWGKQDLNLRPHAYQACALTN